MGLQAIAAAGASGTARSAKGGTLGGAKEPVDFVGMEGVMMMMMMMMMMMKKRCINKTEAR